MPALNFSLSPQLKSPAAPKLRIVSREPFSPIASFLLGVSSGLAAAGALFAFFML